MHAFPPSSMIGKVLFKVKTEEVDVDNNKLASTTLVQSGSGINCNQTSASTSVKQHFSKSSGPSTPSRREQNPKTSDLESFRQSLTSKEISERDAELITGTR